MCGCSRQSHALAMCASFGLLLGAPVNGQVALSAAQNLEPPVPQHDQEPPDHSQMNMNMNAGWQFMQDGVLFAEFNHEGGPRGGDEFVVPNWWMGMVSRGTSRG